MLMLFFFFISIFNFVLLLIFFFISKYFKFDYSMSSVFECGYTCYFFSRFSFSMHYFIIGLIFLFLDLEICYLMPFFNEDFSNFMMYFFFWIFIIILILGLLEEWKEGLLTWKFLA